MTIQSKQNPHSEGYTTGGYVDPNTVPAGYRKNATGHLVPESLIKPIDAARDRLVIDIIHQGKLLSDEIARYKANVFNDIATFVQKSAEEYEVQIGGTKGNISLISFDGRYKVVRQIQESLIFDERLQAAKQLIDDCIHAWTEGSRDEIKALINDAFQVNKQGQINTGRVLGLKRLNITDERWQRAMQAIADSVQITGTKPYVRLYERVVGSDEWKAIPLDIASA